MSDLPKGWVTARLDELLAPEPAAITDGPFGSNLKTEHYQDSGPRVIRLQNIGDGDFRDERAHISVERFQALGKHEARAGDIIVAALGETLPRACLVPPGLGPAIVKADCIRVRLHPEMDARFVSAMLNSPPVRKDATAQISGVGRPRLNLAKIRSIRLPVPPVKEQERIVAAIQVQLSRLDTAEQLLGRVRRRSAQMRAAVLAQAVEADWPVRPLGELLVSVRNGIFVSRPAPGPPGVPIFRISAVRPLQLDLSDIRYAPISLSEAHSYLLNAGDLLFTRYSGNPAYVGACAVVPAHVTTVIHPDKLIRGVVDRSLVMPEFVAIAINVGEGRRQIDERLKTTAGQVGIAGGQLKTVEIPIPPLKEQERLVAKVEHSLTILDALATATDHALLRSDHLRHSILERAFSGQLVPQDSGDEPAFELLARIASDDRKTAKPRRRQ